MHCARRNKINDSDPKENGSQYKTPLDSQSTQPVETSHHYSTRVLIVKLTNVTHLLSLPLTWGHAPSLTASSLVTVTVGDVNDQVPSFVDTVCGDELSPPGTRLLQFEIVDENSERNFVFQIVSDNQNVQHVFTIDSSDGTLWQRAIQISDDHLPIGTTSLLKLIMACQPHQSSERQRLWRTNS